MSLRRMFPRPLHCVIARLLPIILGLCIGATCLARSDSTEAWVKQNALPLEALTAGSGFKDLQALRPLIGSARVVALGECTHGTKEIFQVKHRLLEYLVNELGFSFFAIEANMPEAQALDAYVHGADGDVDTLIRNMHFWTWSTVEVRDMVEWMRRYNADPANSNAGRQVGFTGFDMQYSAQSTKIVRDFFAKNDPGFLPRVTEASKAAETAVPTQSFGFANGFLLADRFRGKHVIFSGWIRTEDIKNGWAGLWLRADTETKTAAAFENMQKTGPRGTTSWTRYEIALDIPSDATNTSFGVIMPGTGKAWFDDLQITVDGVIMEDYNTYDFEFESGKIRGLPARSTGNYVVEISDIAHRGRHSLGIRSVDKRSYVPAETALALWQECDSRLQVQVSNASTPASRTEAAWVRQNARIVIQKLETVLKKTRRDECMAENVLWLVNQDPQRKIVLWAHNGHVAKDAEAMGGFLEKKLGHDYVVFGFAIGGGSFRGVTSSGAVLKDLPLSMPKEGSIESMLDSAGMASFILDLRPSLQKGKSPARWFNAEHPHRMVGASEMSEQFMQRNIGRDYDFIIWLNHTQPSVTLPEKERKP